MPITGGQQTIDEQRRILAGPHRFNAQTGKYEPLPGVVVPPAKKGTVLDGAHEWVPGVGHEPGRYVPARPSASPAVAALANQSEADEEERFDEADPVAAPRRRGRPPKIQPA